MIVGSVLDACPALESYQRGCVKEDLLLYRRNGMGVGEYYYNKAVTGDEKEMRDRPRESESESERADGKCE